MFVIATAGFIVFGAFCAVGVRTVVEKAKLAAFIAAVIASGMAQIGTRIYLGYFDPFWPFALGGEAILAWIGATIGIYFFDKWRGAKRES